MCEKTNQQLLLDDWAEWSRAKERQLRAATTRNSLAIRVRGPLWKKIAKHQLYSTWSNMKERCYNPFSKDFHNYGGRGIKICERWKSFANFLDDMGPRPPGHTIDRVDGNGNYCPENCKWATPFQQAQHTRSCRYLEYNGERLTIAQWARKLNVKHAFIKLRLRRGWSVDAALTLPSDKYKGFREFNARRI